jgi:Xaa-Pro aminopeptidase
MKELSEQPTTHPTFAEITYPEYKARVDKAKALMERKEIDALLIFDIDNIRYYTGHIKASYGSTYGWRRGIVIPKDRDLVFVSASEIYRNVQISTWVSDIRPWGGPEPEVRGWPKEHERVFIEAIEEAKAKRVGVELADYMKPEITRGEFDNIRKGLAKVEFVDASELIMEQRMIKSQYEQGVIRELVTKVCKVVEKSIREFRPGMTERDLHRMFWLGFIEEGIHEDPMAGRYMMSGPGRYDAFIMGPTNTRLKKGDTLFIDGGPRYKGYFCDIQRNICMGKPSEVIKRLHKISVEATEAALDVVKPGAKASDVYFAAKKALKAYDKRYEMSFFAGHSIGFYTHELPYLDEKTDLELKPGMYLAVEVAAPDLDSRVPRCAIMMPEDNVIVTEKGHDNLSKKLSKELWIIE